MLKQDQSGLVGFVETLLIVIVIIAAAFLFWRVNNTDRQQYTPVAEQEPTKLQPPPEGKIYFGAFPDFGGPEDKVTSDSIYKFEQIAGKDIAWAYFSNNWSNGIAYPDKAVNTILESGRIPFVRLMPRSNFSSLDYKYSLQKIVDGKFDEELRRWARSAKAENTPMLVDFAVEMNGNWFPWSGIYNGGGKTNAYGDASYPDGPELFRDAYRHIIDLFRAEEADNITWFFHPDINSFPSAGWNQAVNYYPGDDYIDWIGVSVYGPQNPGENYWETFSQIISDRYKTIARISTSKPIALLEFGVTDNHPLGKKAAWLDDAFKTILNNGKIDFSAISYWHENWEETDEITATLRIDSSPGSQSAFRRHVSDPIFISELEFSTE